MTCFFSSNGRKGGGCGVCVCVCVHFGAPYSKDCCTLFLPESADLPKGSLRAAGSCSLRELGLGFAV